jgi:hypothetical protein
LRYPSRGRAKQFLTDYFIAAGEWNEAVRTDVPFNPNIT